MSCAESVAVHLQVIAFGTDFDENITHLFLHPSNLAFRKLRWHEGLGVTYGSVLVCAVVSSLGFGSWVLIAEGGPRWPGSIDFGDPSKHESMPREFCSWLLAIHCLLQGGVGAFCQRADSLVGLPG